MGNFPGRKTFLKIVALIVLEGGIRLEVDKVMNYDVSKNMLLNRICVMKNKSKKTWLDFSLETIHQWRLLKQTK